jgi:uncharacterized repeat protein (TIGR03803 family)
MSKKVVGDGEATMFIRQLLGALCALACAGQSDAASNQTIAAVTPTSGAVSLTPLQNSPIAPWVLWSAVMGADGAYYVVLSDSSASGVGIEKVTSQGGITALHTFSPVDASGHNVDGTDAGRLRFNAAGDLYGVSSAGGAYGSGTLFTLTPSGAFTTLLSFNFQGQSLDPESNDAVQAADGAYYGIVESIIGAGPQYYKVSADGAFTSLCTLPLPPWHRVIRLIAASDGSIYGLMGRNFGMEVIRLTPSCGMTQLYAIDPSSSTTELSDMVLASDGNLYVSEAKGDNKIIKLTTSGVASDFYVFPFDSVESYIPGYWRCARPTWPWYCNWVPPEGWYQAPTSINVTGSFPTRLAQGQDGNLYGTTSSQGLHAFGTIFRLTPTGSFSTLFATANIAAQSDLMQDAAGDITFFSGATPDALLLAKLGFATSLTTGISFSLPNVDLGQATVLSWSSTGAQSCSLITDIPGLPASKSVAMSGSQTVRLYSKGRRTPAQYTAGIECTAADGSISNAITNVTIN